MGVVYKPVLWNRNKRKYDPQKSRKASELFFFCTATLMLVIGFLFVLGQTPFTGATFEFAEETELVGILIKHPVPMLRIEDEGTNKHVLLVSFGKYGALRDIEDAEREWGADLQGHQLKIRGHLFYRDDRMGFQLTDRSEAIEVLSEEVEEIRSFDKDHLPMRGLANLSGEIVDPKCYLGVMRPGEGTVHRSCAIRCILGGIAPTFVTNTSPPEIFFLLTQDGIDLEDELVKYVGNPVQLCGQVYDYFEWRILFLPSPDGLQRLNTLITPPEVICN